MVHADLGHAARLAATGREGKARGGKVRPHGRGSKRAGPARCGRERRAGGPGQQAHLAPRFRGQTAIKVTGEQAAQGSTPTIIYGIGLPTSGYASSSLPRRSGACARPVVVGTAPTPTTACSVKVDLGATAGRDGRGCPARVAPPYPAGESRLDRLMYHLPDCASTDGLTPRRRPVEPLARPLLTRVSSPDHKAYSGITRRRG